MDKYAPTGSADDGPDVGLLRSQLARLGYGATSVEFDASLDAAVREFQRDRGLAEDGKFEGATADALDEALLALPPLAIALRPADRDQLTAVQERLAEVLRDADPVISRIFGVRRNSGLTSLNIARTRSGSTLLSFGVGSVIECFCVPPGICVPCEDSPCREGPIEN